MSTQARQDIKAAFAQMRDDWAAYPLVIETDNRTTIDQATQTKPYLKVIVEFMGGGQADMADRPRVRQDGQIEVHIVDKCGNGTAEIDALADFILPYLDMKNLGIVHTHAVERYKGKDVKGWWHEPLLINFWFHRVSA